MSTLEFAACASEDYIAPRTQDVVYFAVWCSVEQCGAVRSSGLQCEAVGCSVAVWCSVVQCGAMCCSVVQVWCTVYERRDYIFALYAEHGHVGVCCSVLQRVAACCSVLRLWCKCDALSAREETTLRIVRRTLSRLSVLQ